MLRKKLRARRAGASPKLDPNRHRIFESVPRHRKRAMPSGCLKKLYTPLVERSVEAIQNGRFAHRLEECLYISIKTLADILSRRYRIRNEDETPQAVRGIPFSLMGGLRDRPVTSRTRVPGSVKEKRDWRDLRRITQSRLAPSAWEELVGYSISNKTVNQQTQ